MTTLGEWIDRWNAEWVRAREDGESTAAAAAAAETAHANTREALGPKPEAPA